MPSAQHFHAWEPCHRSHLHLNFWLQAKGWKTTAVFITKSPSQINLGSFRECNTMQPNMYNIKQVAFHATMRSAVDWRLLRLLETRLPLRIGRHDTQPWAWAQTTSGRLLEKLVDSSSATGENRGDPHPSALNSVPGTVSLFQNPA